MGRARRGWVAFGAPGTDPRVTREVGPGARIHIPSRRPVPLHTLRSNPL
jgi:hypothetical protein